MEDEISDDFQKVIADTPMDTDEGPLINENSNGLSHLLTEGEFNSVEAVAVDESSTSNQGFLNAVELSGGSVGDYLDNNTDSFNANSFDVGDNAVTFPSDSLSNVLSDGDSHISDGVFKTNPTDMDGDLTGHQAQFELESEISNDVSLAVEEATVDRTEVESESETKLSNTNDQMLTEESTDLIDSMTNNACDTVELLDSPPNNDVQNAELNNGPEKSDENVGENKEEVDKVAENKESEVDKVAENKESEVGGAEETEVVSEDELPVVEKPRVKDAENVSDDELPGPKPAELPADTEVVSEDELPSSKKEGKDSRKRKNDDEKGDSDGGSQTSVESANKKQAVVKNGESKPIPAEKRSSTDEKPKKKDLPELEKYWKVVNEDPTDFTGWTYLLQYVDQEGEVEASREAYDAFLSHYPYCYGYWRKYADYEKRKGSKKKCLEVLERGLKAIPLSVDLWIHYLNHVKTTRTDEHVYIRSQYERAIEACGLEFRSDRLWESYVKWEQEHGSPLHVTGIYDRLLATPTLGYTSHFEHFQEHVAAESVTALIPCEELVRLREEARAAGGGRPPALDLPPGEDEPPDHIASDEEAQAIKELIIQARKKVHKATGEEVTARWTFEEGIKRPYFHVKPLERCQLKNWKSYLEWEKQNGSFKRALILHERCLIACALYDEFWMRLIRFLEERSATQPELVTLEREVLERACGVHHLDKPDLHLHWAHFEEAQGNAARAADILERIEKTCPGLVQIQYRRVNLERRRGDQDKCIQLYESYITSAKSKSVASALSIKYARFLFYVKKDAAAARKALDEAVTKDPLNQRLHMQRLDLALHTPDTPYSELEELVTAYEKQENAEPEACAAMAWRRRELAEELGDAGAALRAAAHQRALARALRKRARKEKHDPPPPPSIDAKKKESNTANTAVTTATGNSYYQQPAAQAYDQQYAQSYQAPPWGYQQPPGPYQHHPWPQYPNYY